ncbi:extracellular solute-binding protein [Paenibacillus segetis]|nr:extracellular solute-binding protein [Paenibacillus segetis]
MRKGLIVGMLLCMVFVSVACSSTKSSENAGPSDSTATAVVDPNVPGWKSDLSPITFDWYINFSWFTNKWGEDYTSKFITEKTGVNLNLIVPAGNENEKLQTMIASGNLPDFLTLDVGDGAIQKLIDGGLVESWNELADKYDPYFFKASDPDKVKWFTQEDGNFYGYPNASSSPNDFKKYGVQYTSNQAFVVRKDMYEALGKPDMRTPEGFLNALVAAKEMFPDVDGQPLIPISFHEFSENGNYSLESFLQNFLAIPQEKDGKLYDRSTDPEYLKWLKTFRKANEMGLFAKDIFIDKRPQVDEKVTQGRYFSMLYQISDIGPQNAEIYLKDPNKIYIPIDGPANSNLDQPTLLGPSINGWTLTLISKNVKDKKRAIEFMTYMISEEGQKDIALGVEGITYEHVNGKDQFIESYLKDTSGSTKYGAQQAFWMLMDTNMWLNWAPPTIEPYLTAQEWSKGKTYNFSEFSQLDPVGTSDEGIAGTNIKLLWGKTLTKLLLSKSDAEFDEIYEKFLKERDKLGYDKVIAYQQKKYEENRAKLSIE